MSSTTPIISDIPLQHIEINGANLAYKIWGDENKPLLITLHGGRGFGSHGSDFKAYLPLSTTHRILSFDFRGHGQSSFTRPFTFAQIVQDVESLRVKFTKRGSKEVVDNVKVAILGGSFGGYIAQQYALTYPNHVSFLILRGTAPSHEHVSRASHLFESLTVDEAEAFITLRERLHKAPLASLEMLAKVFGSFKDDDEMRLVMFAIGPLYSEGVYNANAALESCRKTIYRAESHNELYSETEKYFDYRPRLGDILAPTLIIVGEKDWICSPSQSRIIHDGIIGSKLVVVPNANHSVHHEQNELVVTTIRDFLTTIS